MVLINKNFNLKDGIIDFDLKNAVTLKVGKFYEEDPFPNYKISDNKHTILQIGEKNSLVKEFKNFSNYFRN